MYTLRNAGITLLALSMGFGNVAMAQGRDNDRGSDRDRQVERRGGPDREPGRGPGTAMRPDGSSRWDGPGVRGDRGDGGAYRGPAPVARQHEGEWRGGDGRRHDGPRDGQWRAPDRAWQGPDRGWRGPDREWREADRGWRGHDNGWRGDVRGPRGEWRGAGPNHDFYRGGRLPPQYRSGGYVVEDWRGHRLSAPPHGYHWVQAGGDYVLAAIATGVILSILLNN